jgi:hypothetical protein
MYPSNSPTPTTALTLIDDKGLKLSIDDEDDVKNNSLNRTDRNTLGRYMYCRRFNVEHVDTSFCGLRDVCGFYCCFLFSLWANYGIFDSYAYTYNRHR